MLSYVSFIFEEKNQPSLGLMSNKFTCILEKKVDKRVEMGLPLLFKFQINTILDLLPCY